MSKVYIFQSCIGHIVLDENLNIIEISKKDVDQIEKKHPDISVLRLSDMDSKKYAALSKQLRSHLREFYEANLRLTKKQVSESVTDDLLILHAVRSIDEINRAISTMIKRLREWYELYNPELSTGIEDNERFVNELLDKSNTEINEGSMGKQLDEKDIDAIILLARQIKEIYDFREIQTGYLEEKMKEFCPNITSVAGVMIGARLISIAGSLERLAKMPSSTLQILGAERALFRHMRNRNALPPKYGVLHEHPLIIKAKRSEHGRIARALADKISIGARVDFFKGSFFGDRLKKEIEDRFGKY